LIGLAMALFSAGGAALTYYSVRKHSQNAHATFNLVSHQINGGAYAPRYNFPQPSYNPSPFGQPYSQPAGGSLRRSR
jgi:hypothetical protein